MLKKIGLYVALAAVTWGTVACNDDTENVISADYSSTQVTAFALRSNSDILNNLDSVFFAIDLTAGRIFNADSLPYGTRVSRLLVDITTDGCSTVEVRFPREGKSDSVINYLTNPDDSIDFSRGPVILHLVSYDKVASRDYSINVNVHKMVSDSLQWDLKHPAALPTTLGTPRYQRTVEYDGRVYTYTTDGTADACVAVADDPASQAAMTAFRFPFTPRLEMLTATTGALYVLADDGGLYQSADGTTWTPCGETWESITAPYGDKLLGLAKDGDKLYHVTYPAGTRRVASADFPVSGNSRAIHFTSDWSKRGQAITVGGRKADGTIATTVWAYDGESWACLNKKIPMEAESQTLFPYYCCKTDSNTWRASSKSVIVAMGGVQADGTMQDTVYISYDLGFNWAKAPAQMQLPAAFRHTSDAQAVVSVETQYASRAIRPITEWDTPYIYMYGGYTATGELLPYVYRGVINRLEFKPLQ